MQRALAFAAALFVFIAGCAPAAPAPAHRFWNRTTGVVVAVFAALFPVGALAVLDGDEVRMEALLAADGAAPRRATGADVDPEALGRRLAHALVETDRP